MGKLTDILSLAQQRGQAMGLPYAGAVLPAEAFDLLRLAPGAMAIPPRLRIPAAISA